MAELFTHHFFKSVSFFEYAVLSFYVQDYGYKYFYFLEMRILEVIKINLLFITACEVK